MACKSMITTRLATPTAVAAGGTVPLGTAVHGYGSNIKLNGNTITINGSCAKAYYRITAHITVTPTAATGIVFSILDGTTVLDYAGAVPAAAGDEVDMTVIATVFVQCACMGNHSISFTMDSTGTVQDMAVEVEQL